MSRDKPTVHLLATGGTIANPLDIDGYLTGRELLDEVPAVDTVADIDVTDVASIGSSEVSSDVWWALHETIMKLVNSSTPPDGFVITHGSNTLEETAYFLNLTLDTNIPVVLTAAQRNQRSLGNDGERNLVDAVRVAGHADAVGRGVLVVVNDTIQHARDVIKTVSGRPDAWMSGDFGPIGLTDKNGRVSFYRSVDHLHTTDTAFDIAGTQPDEYPNIPVVYSTAGADGTLVKGAISEGADGLVIAAFPTGSVARPPQGSSQKTALEDVSSTVPVVISHRGFEGWPNPNLITDHTFIWANTLTPQKASVLLALGLMHTDDRTKLQHYFESY